MTENAPEIAEVTEMTLWHKPGCVQCTAAYRHLTSSNAEPVMRDLAAPGQVLIGQRVHAEIESLVDAEPVGDLELKGFARPVTAYAVRGSSRAPA